MLPGELMEGYGEVKVCGQEVTLLRFVGGDSCFLCAALLGLWCKACGCSALVIEP